MCLSIIDQISMIFWNVFITRCSFLVLGYRFGGAARHRVVIPVVIPQFHLAGMTTLWPAAVQFAYPVIVHYEYMALAQNTSVLHEAMLLFVEPRRIMYSAEYADICENHVKTTNCCS